MNGEMLHELQRMLDGDAPIPQDVTNRMVVAALQEFLTQSKRNTEEIKSAVDDLHGRIKVLEDKSIEIGVKDGQYVKWPYLFHKFGQPTLQVIITALIVYVLARIGLVAP